MSGTSIDDLLGGARPVDDVPTPSERQGAVVVKTALAVAALSVVGMVAIRLANQNAPWWFVIAAATALVLMFRSVRQARPPLPSRLAGRSHGTAEAADGLRHAVRRWEKRLEWCQSDTSAFSKSVRPSLAEIVDERLRQRHGISRESDPALARRLIGDPLWTFLTEPVRRPPNPRDLANLIAWMERI